MTPGAPTVQLRVWLCSFCPLPHFPNILKLSIPARIKEAALPHSQLCSSYYPEPCCKEQQTLRAEWCSALQHYPFGNHYLKSSSMSLFLLSALYLCHHQLLFLLPRGLQLPPCLFSLSCSQVSSPPYKGRLSGIYQSYLECEKIRWSTRSWEFQKVEFSLPDILKHSNSLIWKAGVYSTCKMALKILNLLAFQGTAQDFENKQIQIKNVFILLSVDITCWIL